MWWFRKVFLIFNSLVLSFSSFSQSTSIQSFKTNSSDFNADNVADTFYIQDKKSKKIKLKKADLNGDGRIDFWSRYLSQTETLYQWDTNFDNIVDKRESRLSNGEAVIERDLNFDGLYDWKKTFSLSSSKAGKLIVEVLRRSGTSADYEALSRNEIDLIQGDEQIDSGICNFDEADLLSLRQFDIFANVIDYNLQSGRRGGRLFTTSYGHKIDEGCFDIYGKKAFLKVVQKAVTQGAACLQKLNTAQSLEHLHKISDLLEGRFGGPKIDCTSGGSRGQSWEGAALARGAVGKGEIWLRPDYKEKYFDKEPSSSEAEQKLSSTLFHEMLHNIGYPHNEGVEYVYTCQRCCNRLSKDSQAVTQAACNICKTSYGPDNQLDYLKEISTARTLSSTIIYEENVDRFLQEDAHSADVLDFLYRDSSTDFLKAVGRSRAIKEIMTSRSLSLSPEALLTQEQQYSPYSAYIDQDPTGGFQRVANAHELNFYFLNLKSQYQSIDKRDRSLADKRKKIAEEIYDIFESFDPSPSPLSAQEELENRRSMQVALESMIMAYESVNKGGRLNRDLRAPRRASELIRRYLDLKKRSRENKREIEKLDP